LRHFTHLSKNAQALFMRLSMRRPGEVLNKIQAQEKILYPLFQEVIQHFHPFQRAPKDFRRPYKILKVEYL
jgi:hypothetical protein